MREEIVNGKKCRLVDKISELFITGIPELDADLHRFDEAMAIEPESERKCVYVIGFTDGTTKVGISKNPQRRISVIEKQSGRSISDYRISIDFPTKTAFEIECLLKQVLSPYGLQGEFFNVPFKKVLGLFEHYVAENT